MAADVVTIGVVCADVKVRPVDTLPERGSLALVPELKLQIGGLAGVTAITIAKLGASASLMAGVGNDGFGQYLVSELEASGVNTEALIRGDKPTSATVVLIADDGERTFLHQVGATAALTEDNLDYDYISRAKVFHWGGPSVTPGLDGPPMGRVFERIKKMGVTTSIDTCYDGQGLWLGHIEAALPHTDIVMSSIDEARMYTGKDSPEKIADFYRSYGPEHVLIKLGPEGVYVKNSTTSAHVPGHQVDVIDTTGAGDAACGGFLYGYVQGWDALECARFANAVGAMAVKSMGGVSGIDSIESVLELSGVS